MSADVAGSAADGLVVSGLEVARSGSTILRDVDLVAPAGQVTVLLGPNGAGKTTLLEAASGIIGVAKGSVSLAGATISGLTRSARARLGLAHVEQGRTIFSDLTVEENLLVAGPRAAIAASFELFPELANRRGSRAALLSGGEQQMLVIARALVNRPKVLLLDEMSLGLAPIVVQRLIPIVRRLADEGVGVLLVEQFAALALSIGDSASVLVRGTIAYSGPATELRDDPERLRALYLGAALPTAAG